MIQLLALDLDDTLLREDLSISPRNRAAVQQAEDLGVKVVLASGRAMGAMEHYAEDLGLFAREGYLISDNGSTVSSTLPRVKLVSHALGRPLFLDLLAAFEVLGLPVQVYQDRTILVTRENPVTHIDMGLSGFRHEVRPDLGRRLGFDPVKLVIPGEPSVLAAALPVVRRDFAGRVNAFISKPYFLEVLPLEADKGTALRFVAESLGLDAASVMAIGDAGNDLGMIRWAGWGAAMANGTDEVKQAARVISRATHDQDGVAELIEDYVIPAARRGR